MSELSLQHKPDFERARTYWDALWNHQIIDRPCTVVTAAKRDNAPFYSLIQSVDANFSQGLKDFDMFLESHAFLGEAIPAFRPGFGPDQMAAFLGASLTISEDGKTSWSTKIVDNWQSFLPLRIDPDNLYWRRMKQFHAVAQEHFKGRCLIREIDLHSNMDLLEGLRGAERLLFDMIDSPDTILMAMSQAHEVFEQVCRELYQYAEKGKWGTTSILPFYSRGRFNRLQSDFIALLSPDLFRKFVLDGLQAEGALFDHSCFHLDGPDALTHLDDLLAIKEIDAIQWIPGAGNPPQIEWPELLHKIQNAGKIIILQDISAGDVKRIHGQYKPELLVYDVWTETVEEGMELLEWLEKNT